MPRRAEMLRGVGVRNKEKHLDVANIPLTCVLIFILLSRGATVGVAVDEIAWGHMPPIQHLYGHGPG